jgi:tyrosyl-tRNA synthetase
MEEWFPLFVDFTVEDVHPMDKKKMLATEIVAQLCGAEKAFQAGETFVKRVQHKELPDEILTILASTVIDAVVKMGISRNSARQLLGGGAVRVDGRKVSDERLALREGQLVQCGKRNFARIGHAHTVPEP